MHVKKNRLVVVASMIVLGLASISAIEAGHKQQNRYKHQNKYKHSRGNPLVRQAFQIEDQARFVERRAERLAGRGYHREYRALVRLDQVRDEARDFRRALERHGPYSRRTDEELYRLTRAVRKARHTLRDLRAFRQISRDFRELTVMVDDMRYQLQTVSARHNRGHRKAYPTRRSGSRGYVSIGKSGKHGRASIGFSWDDED